MTQIAYPQAETEPAADNRSHTENHLVQADQAEIFCEEQIEALRDENGVIDYRHYLNKAHHLRSCFWWGLFKKVLSKDGKDTEVLK